HITLAQALPKLSKIDSIIQKATELGAYEIIPMITERTIARPKNSAGKLERWKKIAVEASKQCRRKSLPKIADVTAFSDMLKKIKEFDVALIFSTGKDNKKLRDLLKNFSAGKILILIGPEGDFSPSEESCARAQGCHPISLGEIILRCETAAVAALSVINYELSTK
ncbi:MAG: RNA methyltransferase, partial [Candidatus Omnitrophica bacterium]|nr:RNA methyltransferase [Candidatus Omnitrophota bacterium]